MRETAAEVRPRTHAPEPAYSPTETLTATVLLAAAVSLVLLAATSPVAAAGAVVATVVAYWTVRALLRRRRHGRTRSACVPGTRVCVGV